MAENTLSIRAVDGQLTHAELDGNRAHSITKATHGFVAGDLLTVDATDYVKAIATAKTTLARAAVIRVVDANTFYVTFLPAPITKAAHGLGARGTRLFLSQTVAGAFTATEYGSGILQPVGIVLSADLILFDRSLHQDL